MTTSCAGGLQADCKLPVSREQKEGCLYEVKVTGLQGGHSGGEIHKERGNAVVLLGRVLDEMRQEIPFSVENLHGGLKDNAIPREAVCRILLPGDAEQELPAKIASLEEILKKEYKSSDSGVEVKYERLERETAEVLTDSSLIKVLFFLRTAPWGVQHMSTDIEGLVETSLNPGIMKLEEQEFSVCFSVRSSVTSRKYEVTKRLEFLTEFLGGEITVSGDYPAWEYKAESPMRELMREVYCDLFQEEPKIQAIHAGLECGILSGKIENLDCISFGPNNFDIHTPKERLSISSTERVWKLILEFLKRSK